jgi:hypothetical protein
MQKEIVRKGLVLVIILCIIGVGCVPSITGGTQKQNQRYENQIITNTNPLQASFASPPEEEWNQTYSGYDGSYVFCAEDGYVIGGSTDDAVEATDYLLIKVDTNGNEQWRHTFGRYGHDQLEAMAQTTDEGYILLGASDNEEDVFNDIWLVRTNNQGNILWNTTVESLGFHSNDYSIQQTSDLGFIIAGGNPVSQPLITKLNSDGSMVWNKTYACPDFGYTCSVVQTTDGGYALTGYISPQYTFLIKTDSSGNELWRKTYSLPDSYPQYYTIIQTSDKGFIITQTVMNESSLESYPWVFKTNMNGVMEWQSQFSRQDSLCIRSIQQTIDDGYIVTGHNFDAVLFGFAMKIDKTGSEKWRKIMTGGNEYLLDGAVTPDLGYILSGASYSYGSYKHNVWLVKLSPENYPPFPPTITGPLKGKINIDTDYNFTVIDPNGDEVFYSIDWGDGTNSSWIGPYVSGEQILKSHTWSTKGDYTIRAKAKDTSGNESDWGQLTVTMPYSIGIPLLSFWEKLFERFPHVFPILRHMVGF